MSYASVDELQRVLTESVFGYAKDAKKAAGRALGTLVELITFYLLKTWGLEGSVSIERAIPEYGNYTIAHNVEYSLHPILTSITFRLSEPRFSVNARRIMDAVAATGFDVSRYHPTGQILLTSGGTLRNSCLVGIGKNSHLVATLDARTAIGLQIVVTEQFSKPYAIVECKRVGVEDGVSKGPQTIEKAKQGAYVAKAVSSLQKVRDASGNLVGLVFDSENRMYARSYDDILFEIVNSDRVDLLRDFVLTVGVVSNHGNWFTSEDHNKELKVLAQSYDWLLFLTDQGLAEFISELLLDPAPLLISAQESFLASYTGDRGKNQFTKVQIGYRADQVLQKYFRDNLDRIETWFNVLAPRSGTLTELNDQLCKLRSKEWSKVYEL